jgi:hypothetical protein
MTTTKNLMSEQTIIFKVPTVFFNEALPLVKYYLLAKFCVFLSVPVFFADLVHLKTISVKHIARCRFNPKNNNWCSST